MNTYILFWGPTLSWYDLNEVEDEIEEGICREFAETKPWPITSQQDIKKGDRFFILCVEDTAHANCHSFIDPRSKDAKFYALDGICFGGFFTSDPYDSKDEDDGERVIDLQFDFAVFPGLFPTINTKILEETIPDFDWFHVDGEYLIESENERKFIELVSSWMKSSRMAESPYANFSRRNQELAYCHLFGTKFQ